MDEGWLGHLQSFGAVPHQTEVGILIDGAGNASINRQRLAFGKFRRDDSQAGNLINHFLVLAKDMWES